MAMLAFSAFLAMAFFGLVGSFSHINFLALLSFFDHVGCFLALLALFGLVSLLWPWADASFSPQLCSYSLKQDRDLCPLASNGAAT
jgi:hypothetical protein